MKADIFSTVGRKYFWSILFKRAFKKLSEAHEFCPFSFRNGATVVSQSTAKNDFFDCLTYTTGVFHGGLMVEFGAGCEIIVGV